MIAILVYEGFAAPGVWARVDLAMLSTPDVEEAERVEIKEFLSGDRAIYRTGKKVPRAVNVELAQCDLDVEVKFGRDVSSQYEHPTAHRNLASLLLDALLNGRTVEFILYQTGKSRGSAFQGELTGPDMVTLFGDVSTGDNREPGGQVPGSVELRLEPVSYGICEAVGTASNVWLAGTPLVVPV